MSLTRIVQHSDTRAGRLFDLAVVLLVLVMLAIITVESIPGLQPWVYRLLRTLEALITVLFTAEYVLRIATAPRRMKYVTSFYGVIDLVAIAPFYLTLGSEATTASIRVLRALRIVRILKLTRYNKAMGRFRKAFGMAKEEIVIFLGMIVVLLYLSACGIYYFEHDAQPELFKSIPHSFWWALITLTTVGYGDVYPVTIGGRFFTFLMLLVGVCVIAIPAGIIASSLTKVLDIEKNHAVQRRGREDG